MAERMRFATILIDFENVYYFLRNNTSGADAGGLAVGMVRQLRRHLEEQYREQAISLAAYADFERIDDEVMGPLYLAGVETHNVLGTDHKNAADMRLCIDAMATLYTRSQIESFIVVAGDRDYIPLVQHLTQQGRTVRVAGFLASVSGDLRKIVGEENFIELGGMLGGVALTPTRRPSSVVQTPQTPPVPGRPAPPAADGSATDSYERVALDIMLTHFGDKKEIWMAPYLHRLRAALPELAEPERKEILGSLEGQGAIRVERRPGRHSTTGEAIEYSVILLNWNHPGVRAASTGR